ncbi:unnamed protein product [Lota lota]
MQPASSSLSSERANEVSQPRDVNRRSRGCGGKGHVLTDVGAMDTENYSAGQDVSPGQVLHAGIQRGLFRWFRGMLGGRQSHPIHWPVEREGNGITGIVLWQETDT